MSDGDNYEEDKEGKEDRTCLGQRLCNCNFKYDAMEGLIKKMTLLQKYKRGRQPVLELSGGVSRGREQRMLFEDQIYSLPFFPSSLSSFISSFQKKKKKI